MDSWASRFFGKLCSCLSPEIRSAIAQFMPLAILEKFVYSVPVFMLFLTGRVHSNIVRSSFADPIFGILFIMAYFRMRTKINATVVANGQRRMAA